jgi:hypothetical protein
MPYQVQYRMQFRNVENKPITVNIYDGESWTDYEFAETFIHELTPGGDPCHIVVNDNDEEKFSPIKGKRADIQFLSTNQYNAATFRGGKDNRWYVEILNEISNKLFVGYLSTGELEQPFLHNTTFQPVTLTAYDGLELLEDIPLTEWAGENPRGRYRIIEFLAWALSKTNLTLPITAVHNLREERDTTKPMYEAVYLDAKTFEDEVGTCISCREVLEKILGHDAFITQYHEQWWIQRIDEMEWNTTIEHRWSWEGDFEGTMPGQNKYHNIGADQDIILLGKETLVLSDRPVDHTTLTFNYDYPKEIIDNIDFDRGEERPLPEQNLPNGSTKFYLDDWTYGARQGTGTLGYIRRDYIDDYEDARYVVMEPGTGAGQYYFISNNVPLHAKDKFTLSVDWRLDNNFSGQPFSYAVMMVRLTGEDGTKWVLQGGNNPVWQPDTTPDWLMNYYITTTTTGEINQREWQSASVDAPPLPVGGNLQVLLLHDYRETECEIHFQNLQFDYKPFINGSYMKYKGQHHKVSQEEAGYRKKYEEDVYLSDSPKKLFKGHMWIKYILYILGIPIEYWLSAGTFYNAAHVSSPTPESFHRYGYIQAFAVWNQQRRLIRRLNATLYGLKSGVEEPDLIHEYFFTELTADTAGKYFMLLHFDQDLKRCTWSGAFVETFDTTLANSYSDPHAFRYITDK